MIFLINLELMFLCIIDIVENDFDKLDFNEMKYFKQEK